MKKSTQRFCLKLAAGFLSTMLVASIASPINVLATTIDVTESLSENTTVNSSSADYSENIVMEIEEERDEFSKTFLMTDGTYYTYVSPVAIHEYIEDKWVGIDDSLSQTPATISEAEETVKEFVNESGNTSSQISTFALPNINNSISVTCVGNATQTEMGYSLPADGALVIKPTTIINFSENNRVLLSATLDVSLASNMFNTGTALDLKDISSETASNSLDVINNGKNIYFNLYDATTSNYSFDITDSYSKWERGINENYGVALLAPSVMFFSLELTSEPILSFRYKEVSDDDSTFTYHTLDLGKAGILTINDVTNAFKLEQTIAGLDCSLLPVTLTKTIDSTDFSLDSYANVSSKWNYNYSLSIAGSNATLILPQGTKIVFKQTNKTTSDGLYQLWEQDIGEGYVDGVILYIDTQSLDKDVSKIYEKSYVSIDGIKYKFNPLGKLNCIEKGNKTLEVSYEYFTDLEQFVISKLIDANGNQYCISYSTYNVNGTDYVYANNIKVIDSTNADIEFDDTSLEITVENTVANSIITSTYTYPGISGQPITVSYNYDLVGKLLSIISADGTKTQLNYKSANNTYLTGYTQTKGNKIINELAISSNNTFERVFESTFTEKEIQRYDRDFQLVTHYYGDNVVSMTYKNGLIDSYAVNNSNYKETDNLVRNGDFSLPAIGNGWIKIGGSNIIHDITEEELIITNNSIGTDTGVKQAITGLSVDKTYVFYAETEIVDSLPCNDYPFKIRLDFYIDANTSVKSVELPFDVTLMGEKQIRMATFKLDTAYPAISVSILSEGNTGEYHVDNVRVYEATPEDGSMAIPGVSTSDPIANTTIENDQVKNELISNGTYYMLQEYEYASDGAKVVHINDFNAVSTYFDYSGRAEILSEKGHAINDNNMIVDPITYGYNRVGLLQYVSQTINSVTGENLELLTEYTYDSSDRITSVSNNKYCYNFTYNDIGNITNINKETITAETAQTNNLIDYTYANNNIGTIIYSNGYKLEYSYNEKGEITNITCYKLDENNNYTVVGSYTYTYSNGHISETVITSNNLSNDIIIEDTETGIKTYYLEDGVKILAYSKEQENSNTVEKFISSVSGTNTEEELTKTKIIETSVGATTELYSEFYGEKLSFADSESIVATNGSNNVVTDYFGRISSKYSTIESNVLSSTSSDSLVLGLTNNYTYKDLAPVEDVPGIRTSNLIESITNEINITKTSGNTTTNDLSGFAYNYAYDSLGNIRFVYKFYLDGSYYMESYYQYDEANQITATLSPLGCEFYVYDSNGNIVEKILSEYVTISGIDETLIDSLENVTYETWNTINWEAFDDMYIMPFEPESSQYFTYNALGQMIKYEEKSFSYDAEGNITNTTIDNSLEIPYDIYGNPLKYIGKNTVNETIVADLSWNGNQLASAIIYSGSTPEQKLTFTYDENGFRINKTLYEYAPKSNNDTDPFSERQQINYVWDNGQLSNIQIAMINETTKSYIYTNILYDNTGSPCGIITPMGISYYFLKDSSDNVCGLVNSEGETIVEFIYDAFGSLYMEVKGDTAFEEVFNTITAMYNPCTYKGYLYDYDLGIYFIQNKCYSPTWGNTLNETSLETLTEPSNEPLKSNLHLICNNNLVNSSDVNAEWDRSKFSFTSDQSHGIQVEMSKAFLSRPFCALYASKIIGESGSWDYLNGRNLKNMSVERIASNLFARCVGNYAESAVNRVNATWGDGWIVSNRNSEIIIITETDPHADKYLKIWLAAPSIKSFATAHGIYITL